MEEENGGGGVQGRSARKIRQGKDERVKGREQEEAKGSGRKNTV